MVILELSLIREVLMAWAFHVHGVDVVPLRRLLLILVGSPGIYERLICGP